MSVPGWVQILTLWWKIYIETAWSYKKGVWSSGAKLLTIASSLSSVFGRLNQVFVRVSMKTRRWDSTAFPHHKVDESGANSGYIQLDAK